MSAVVPNAPNGGLRFSGVYRRSPWAGQPAEAELECVPISLPQQYAQGLLYEQPVATRVLMSISQRHRLLAELVQTLRGAVSGVRCVLVRLYGPDFNLPLTSPLLVPEVLLLANPMALAPRLLRQGLRNLVVIDQDLRCDGTERGGNALSVTLLAPEPAGAVCAAFTAWAQAQPLLQALDGPRLAAFHQEAVAA